MKILLEQKQVDLLKRANIEYSPETNYDVSDFEDTITDYVMTHEIIDNDTTSFGEALLALHDFIVDKYDS
jgi:hypothetical protein